MQQIADLLPVILALLSAVGALLAVFNARKKISVDGAQSEASAKLSLEEMVNDRIRTVIETLTNDISRMSTENKEIKLELRDCREQHRMELEKRAEMIGEINLLKGKFEGLSVVPVRAILPSVQSNHSSPIVTRLNSNNNSTE